MDVCGYQVKTTCPWIQSSSYFLSWFLQHVILRLISLIRNYELHARKWKACTKGLVFLSNERSHLLPVSPETQITEFTVNTSNSHFSLTELDPTSYCKPLQANTF